MGNKLIERVEEIVESLSNALANKDYDQAKILGEMLIDDLDSARDILEVANLRDRETFIQILYEISNNLLDLADTMFVRSPIEVEKLSFRENLKKASALLNVGSISSAKEANNLINTLITTHENQIQTLEESGNYNPKAFCLFWKLWLFLDNIIILADFPRSEYDSFAASLYGIIAPALKYKESVSCLYKHKNNIFPTIT